MRPTAVAEIEIGSVQVRRRGAVIAESGTTLRLRVDHLLGTADLLPAGMSPSAILIVRRVADPLPGMLAPHLAQVRVSRTWEAAVRAALADSYRRAARPVGGVIPSGADAVLFDDAAQLLAYLALDICTNHLHLHWWWSELPPTICPAPVGLPQLFLRQPDLVPAIVHHLAAIDRIEPIVNALTPAQAMAIVAAVYRAYEISLPDPSVADVERNAQAGDIAPQPADEGRWDRWLPTATALTRFQPERAWLVATALGLYRVPAIIRSRDFQRRMLAWRVGIGETDATRPEGITEVSATDPGEVAGRLSRHQAGAATGVVASPNERAVETRTATQVANAAPVGATPAVQRELPPPDSRVAGIPSVGSAPRQEGLQPDTTTESVAAPAGSFDTADDPFDLPDASAAEAGLTMKGGLATRLGGFVYLINVMCRLGLPDVFEADWALTTTVGPWGTLELLARTFAGDAGVDADPLWDALAVLGDRPAGTLPSLAGSGPPQFSLPDAWVRRFGADADDDSSEPLASPLLAGLGDPERRWLGHVMPYLRKYLSQTIGEHAGGESDMARMLLLQPGQVYISSTHVDVVLPMDAISIPLRLAGLDRDPGWIPDFGRVVKIHFV